MTKSIAVLAGDGIGPEVMAQALRVLKAVDPQQEIQVTEAFIGGAAFDKYGAHFPDPTKEICESADAILFGSVGGPVAEAHQPKWQNCETNSILALRKTFDLSVNLRPAKLYEALKNISPLRSDSFSTPVDILIVRELVGDIYFGEHKLFTENDLRCATDLAEYSESQIKVAAHRAFQTAMGRNKKLCSVDKANVLATSKLWREVVTEVAAEYPEVTLQHMLVDNCAMQLMLNPCQFDVIVTANLFGDILSDLASAIPGSLGLMPSASFSESGKALYEPSGGSAPDIAGQDLANPIAQILSLAMLLRHSFGLDTVAANIERAVQHTLDQGFATKDIATAHSRVLGATGITDQIITELKEL